MYLDYYGLKEAPFATAPDERFVWLPPRLEALLERLEREIRSGSGGIMLLSGEYGSGKTLMARLLLARLAEADIRIARIRYTGVSADELLETVCHALRVPLEPGERARGQLMIDALSAFLMDTYAQGQRVLLVIDEAQELSDAALEQLRQLTNLQTPAHKLIHVLLLAGPSLDARLHSGPLRALAQRIGIREELTRLDSADLEPYVRHRMATAGAAVQPFTRLGLRNLYRYAGGIPRLVNAIADRALQLGAEANARQVGEGLVQRAAGDVLPGHVQYWVRRYRWWWRAALLVMLVGAGLTWWLHTPAPPVASEATAQQAHEKAMQEGARLLAQLPDAGAARMAAWSELLARWQVTSNDVSVSDAMRCNAVVFPGFDCVAGTGTLDQLKRFDRPMLLELKDASGVRHVLLLGVGDDQVRLFVGGKSVEITKAALQTIWHGRFMAPFRLPPWMPSSVHRGDAGQAVAWVRQQLRKLDGDRSGSYRPLIYDQTVQERVRKLQRAYGIPVDGVIGPETLFALSSLDDSGPHLARDVP
ncbi:ExeA family protein [Oleiagrimonas citrea]|uniref:AAA family ATPase n=1 Tax=Oleiagrimonas citrea TaxID=1665687 RepID=A0A846ZRI9_9GAMM|nr:AAA family ATPase [Oleiagrimonas citrea]NKZ40240.1 AAA family ATPase [Oleiagrimonas citrea]